MKKILKISIILLLFSCKERVNNQQQTKVTSFEKVVDLKGETILKGNFSDLIGINVIDTLLMFKKISKETVYEIYNINSLKYLGDLGVRGDKPNAWLHPVYSGQYSKSEKDISLWVNDGIKGQMSLVNITEVLKKKDPTPILKKIINVHPKAYLQQHALFINDSVLIGDSGYTDPKRTRVKSFNFNSNEIINSSGLFPEVKNRNKLNSTDLFYLYLNNIKLKNNYIVSAMSSLDRIDIFDLDLNLTKTIIGKDSPEFLDEKTLIKDDDNTGGTFIYNKEFFLSEKYIFTLYINSLESDFYEKSSPVEIRVYDWNGNGKFKLKIPDHLSSFSIDLKNKWIYGLDKLNEKILRYNINNFLNE
ncbi:hypothetical protein KCTC32516_00405 [Polaribacter huanghezhanensis]|uniref:BF3164 family lipoprotein n=1 Tax=Polaribacter huanghezhanensis TaxID=1354726 RepID=UPI002649436B|nr:BF3164 family lipoprotein [Polaribacter huanghezhanensis]WKD85067.1 hypothetical protein KCTC32516_00405 [Polaribacter huanghezhanensis]